MEQYLLPLERKCFCGGQSDPNPETSNHVRTANGWTIGFCFERCAQQFDHEVATREPAIALQLVTERR